MKYRVTTLFFLASVAAFAQAEPATPPHKNRPQEQQQGREKLRALEFWKKFDLNQDQKLTKDEFIQMPRIAQLPADKQDKLFARLDKDQNTALEAKELQPPGNPPQSPGNGGNEGPNDGKRRSFPRLAEMDKNADKKIDFSEFILSPMIAKLPEDRQKKIFENMDRNKDGALSPEDGPPPGMPKRPGQGPNGQGPNGPRPPEGQPPRGQGPRPNGPMTPGPRPDGQRPNPANQQRVFSTIDQNQDKLIDFAEFQKAPFVQGQGEDAQEDLFEIIDHNDDMKIDEPELRAHNEAHKNQGKPAPRGPKPNIVEPKQPPGGEEPMMDDTMMEGA